MVSLFQWCAVIVIFNPRVSVVSTNCGCKLSRNFITMLEILLLCYYYLEVTDMSFLKLLYICLYFYSVMEILKRIQVQEN